MILILGGTPEARDLASALAAVPGTRVVVALAGRLRQPASGQGETRVGGFGGASGLATWLREHEVVALVDATHPFAAQMSSNAFSAAAETGTPLLRLQRPGWRERPGDVWHRAPDMAAAVEVLPSLGSRILATTGHTELRFLNSLAGIAVLLRCIQAPELALAQHVRLLLARGPFGFDAELALLQREAIDVVLTKDSGGSPAMPKLDAARLLGLPVVMIDRPPPLPTSGEGTVSTVETVADAVTALARLAVPTVLTSGERA